MHSHCDTISFVLLSCLCASLLLTAAAVCYAALASSRDD